MEHSLVWGLQKQPLLAFTTRLLRRENCALSLKVYNLTPSPMQYQKVRFHEMNKE